MKTGKNIKGMISRLIFMGFMLAGISAVAQDGAALFKTNCATCHKIGGGRFVGPDLQGVTEKRSEEWLHQFIKSSQTLIKSGDAEAKQIFEDFNQIMMPDQNLSKEEIQAVIDHIAAQSPAIDQGADATEAAPVEEVQIENSVADATKEDWEAGAKLFSGKTRFANGGPSCVSCHNVTSDMVMAGGTLAKDLTEVYGRMGEMGVRGVMETLPFPAMKDSYDKKPLTEEEVYEITAFLKYADEEKLYQKTGGADPLFLYWGPTALVTLLILFGLLWYNRKIHSVKHDIFKRQLKSK